MAARSSLFILALMWSVPLSSEFLAQALVVWNVGQGQWVTVIEERTCWHFDTGGEKAPRPQIVRACRARHNVVSYSHWDWDHLSFAPRLSTWLPDICLLFPPYGYGSAMP